MDEAVDEAVVVPASVGLRSSLARLARSRRVHLCCLALALLVPVLSLPQLPRPDLLPLLTGLLPWVVGKYVLCPLRWHALSAAGHSRRWYIRAYAESELLGLLTPGHVGADAWRIQRLRRAGLGTPDAVAEAGLDRFVGALGLACFTALAATALPYEMLASALGVGLGLVLAGLVTIRLRPELRPRRALPRPRALGVGLVCSLGYQLSICVLLYATVVSLGYTLSPLELLAAFGASQLAGVLPGPHGASPRDAALALALAALGLPLAAAAAAVVVKASLAWLPGLLLGGPALLAHRRTQLA